MEINGKSPLVDLGTRMNRLETQEHQVQHFRKPGGPETGRDRVELSVRSREMQHINELIRSTSDIREEKVRQIRSSIENGTYNVRAELVADKIVNGSLIEEIF